MVNPLGYDGTKQTGKQPEYCCDRYCLAQGTFTAVQVGSPFISLAKLALTPVSRIPPVMLFFEPQNFTNLAI